MMERIHLIVHIIGKVGTRDRDREGLKVSRSDRSRATWAAREGTAMLGRENEGCT